MLSRLVKENKSKSSLEILSNKEKYHINKCIKLSENNIGIKDSILTIPYYLFFC